MDIDFALGIFGIVLLSSLIISLVFIEFPTEVGCKSRLCKPDLQADSFPESGSRVQSHHPEYEYVEPKARDPQIVNAPTGGGNPNLHEDSLSKITITFPRSRSYLLNLLKEASKLRPNTQNPPRGTGR